MDTTLGNKEPREKYRCIIEVLRFFVNSQRYGIIDRLAFALSPESVDQSIYEALRILKSLEARSIHARIKTQKNEYTLRCCDYGEGRGPGINGVFIEADEASLKGKQGYCVPCPSCYPDEDELRGFLEDVRRDIGLARIVAALAYTHKSRG